MFLIAMIKTALSPDERATIIARHVRMTVVDARGHATVPPPRVLASRPTVDEARDVAEKLSADGLVSAAIGRADILTDAKRFVAHTVAVTDEKVLATRRDGKQAHVTWSDCAAAVVGVRTFGKSDTSFRFQSCYCDVVDRAGNVISVRERYATFEGGSGATGARAAVLALRDLAGTKTAGKVDDRLLKPGSVAQILARFATIPDADDWANSLVLRSLLQS